MTRIALLGAGTVGSAVVAQLKKRHDIQVEIAAVLVSNLAKERSALVSALPLSDDGDAVVAAGDLIIEVMGGTGLARELLLKALEAGKTVITANKAVLAEHWYDFAPYLQQGKIFFEAAVMAGTPAIEPLTGALRGSLPLELHAILNGTCNYILGQLERGISYHAALSEAQRLGYAEADPSLDVGGFDAAHKLTLLAKTAFDPNITWESVKAKTKGISQLTPNLLEHAMQDGGRIRLVGSVYPDNNTASWQAAVRPVYLPAANVLSGSASNRNGFYFKGEALGQVLITGAGAGAHPTASGVVGDIYKVLAGQLGPQPLAQTAPLPENYQADDLGEVDIPDN